MDVTSNLAGREEEAEEEPARCRRCRRCRSLSGCCSWPMLVFIMAALVLTLGAILIWDSSHPLAFSIGICMIVASLIVLAFSLLPDMSNNSENLTQGAEARRRAESSLVDSETLVLSSSIL